MDPLVPGDRATPRENQSITPDMAPSALRGPRVRGALRRCRGSTRWKAATSASPWISARVCDGIELWARTAARVLGGRFAPLDFIRPIRQCRRQSPKDTTFFDSVCRFTQQVAVKKYSNQSSRFAAAAGAADAQRTIVALELNSKGNVNGPAAAPGAEERAQLKLLQSRQPPRAVVTQCAAAISPTSISWCATARR